MSGFGTEERCLVLRIADAGQHFARRQHESPNDEAERQRVREAEPPLPRRNRAPHACHDYGGRADKIEDQLETAAVGVRPGQHPNSQYEAEPAPEPGAEPIAAARAARHVGSVASRGPGIDGDRGHAAPERRIGLRQLLEELVHLPHLTIPVPIFFFVRHYASRARPYRSIFLYRLLRGICNVRAVSDTFQSCSCSLPSRNARSAACLNSSNVAARIQAASSPGSPLPPLPRSAPPRPTNRSTSACVTVRPLARINSRSTAFLSSRMLPGQSCAVSRSSAGGSVSLWGRRHPPPRRAARARRARSPPGADAPPRPVASTRRQNARRAAECRRGARAAAARGSAPR